MIEKSPSKQTTAHLRPVFEKQAELCKALAHAVRLEVLEILGSKEISSAELCELLNLPKANVSQHIQILKDAGLVRVERSGTTNRLSLTMPRIKEACGIVRDLIVSQLEWERSQQAELHDLLNGAPSAQNKVKVGSQNKIGRKSTRAKNIR